MAGGQKGLSLTGEPMAYATVATAIIVVMLMNGVGCGNVFDADPSPREDANEKCDEAWSARYVDHDEDENDTAILDEQWCQEHLDMIETQVATEQNEVQAETVEASP